MGGRPSANGAVGGDSSVLVGDGVSPLGIGLFVDNLAGDDGDDRSPSRDLGRFVVGSDEGLHVDSDVDDPAVALAPCLAATVEQVEIDIGSDLVDTPLVASASRSASQPVDPSHRGIGVCGWEVEADQIGGAVFTQFADHPPFFQTAPVPVTSGGRVGRDDEPLEPSTKLTGGLIGRPFQSGIGHLSRQLPWEMRGLIGDHPRPGEIDQPVM